MGSMQLIDLDCDIRRNKLSELAARLHMTGLEATVLPGGHSEWEPPDPFSNSEVKTLCADASVGFVNAKVGHCQALDTKETPAGASLRGFFFLIAANAASASTSTHTNPRAQTPASRHHARPPPIPCTS